MSWPLSTARTGEPTTPITPASACTLRSADWYAAEVLGAGGAGGAGGADGTGGNAAELGAGGAGGAGGGGGGVGM